MTGRLVTGLAIWSAQKHWRVCPFLLERWDRTRGNNKTSCTEISNYYKPRSDTSPKDLTLQQVFSQHFSAQQVSLSPAPPATSHTHRWGLSKKILIGHRVRFKFGFPEDTFAKQSQSSSEWNLIPIPPMLKHAQACTHTRILLERAGEISQVNIYTVLQRTIKLYEL